MGGSETVSVSMCEQDFALDNLQKLICRKTQPAKQTRYFEIC